MAELIAQSEDGQHRWRRPFDRDVPIILGRTVGWTLPWDRTISRRHARLLWSGESLQVEQLPDASNPIFYQGREVAELTIHPGDYFVIGQTTFTLAQSAVGATLQMPDPAREQLFSRQVLNEVRFRDAEKRLAILGDLPDLIAGAVDEQELLVRLVNVVFGGVDRAVSVAVVRTEASTPREPEEESSARKVEVLHWDRRHAEGQAFQPSQRLILSAIRRQQSILHIWEDPQTLEALTVIDSSHDWAFVVPLSGAQNRNWAIYVSGLLSGSHRAIDSISSIASSLKEDIKFTELVASIVGSLMGLQDLRARESGMRTNMSPQVWNHLRCESDDRVHQPRWQKVTCLFGRLQWVAGTNEDTGTEKASLWEQRFQWAGTICREMTTAVLEHGGVMGASRGETLLGFWGWPDDNPQACQSACRAVKTLVDRFLQWQKTVPGNGDSASLRLWLVKDDALAGPMGDQNKPTVMGPVVEQWHHMESLYPLPSSEVNMPGGIHVFLTGPVMKDLNSEAETMRVQVLPVPQDSASNKGPRLAWRWLLSDE